RRTLQPLVEFLAFDHVEAADLLPRLVERLIGDHQIPTALAHLRRRRRRLQPLEEDKCTARLEVVLEAHERMPPLLYLLLAELLRFVRTDKQRVPHHGPSCRRIDRRMERRSPADAASPLPDGHLAAKEDHSLDL